MEEAWKHLPVLKSARALLRKKTSVTTQEFNSSPDMPLPADLLNVTAINIRRKYVNQYLNYPSTSGTIKHFMSLRKTYLIIAHEARNNRGTQTSGYTDTESTYHAADGQVPDHILIPVSLE